MDEWNRRLFAEVYGDIWYDDELRDAIHAALNLIAAQECRIAQLESELRQPGVRFDGVFLKGTPCESK